METVLYGIPEQIDEPNFKMHPCFEDLVTYITFFLVFLLTSCTPNIMPRDIINIHSINMLT